MKKPIIFLVVLLVNFSSIYSQFSPHLFALRDITLIDGISQKVMTHYTVIIRDKIIESVGPTAEIKIPDSAVVFNLTGKYLLPGLIDTHVHLATDPSNEDNRIRAEKDLKEMLLSGITTVRDMAGDARVLANLSREAGLDEITSPDIYYSALMAGPGFFIDPRTQQTTRGGTAGEMPFMKAVTDSTDMPLAVAAAKGTGASGIKLYAEINGMLAKKITLEAHRQHLLVWSHANLGIATASEVIAAGVNSISHAAMISGWNSRTIPASCSKPGLTKIFWDSVFKKLPAEECIKSMRANKTILDATILTYKEAGSDLSLPERNRLSWLAMYEVGKRFTELARAEGIPVCTGTDTDDKKFVQREIKLLVKDCGFTPMEAIICATKNGALAIARQDKIGVIQPGKTANLLVLSANPVLDIENIDKVELVIKNGKIFNHEK